MDSFSESLQYITKNVDSQFELRLQEFDNTYNENISWLENVSKECKTAFESTIERIFLAEKKTKAKQSRELFTPLKEFNYSAPDRVALSRQLATPASAYRPRTRAAVKQLQQEEVVTANKENQIPVENKIVEEKVVEVKKPAETKKAAPKGKSKVQAAVEKMEEKIIEERFGKKKIEEKPVEQPKKEEVVEESGEEDESEKKEEDEASEKEEDKPQGRAGRLKATRTTAAAKKAAAAAKRAATIAEKKARAAREAEEREKAEKEEQERQAKLKEEKAERERAAAAEAKEKKRAEKEEKERKAKLEKEKAAQEEKERLEREQAEREEKEREAKAKKAAEEEAENEPEEEAPAPKKKGRTTKKTYVKKTTTRGKKRARAAESEDESEAQSASEEVPKPKTKKAKLSNEKSDAEHVIEDVKMDEVKVVEKEEIKKDEEDEVIVDVVGTATPAKRVALPAPAIDDAVMADLPLEFEENIEIITTKTPSKPKVAPRISIDSQDEVDVVFKPKAADFIVHEESEISSTAVASVVEPLSTEVTRVEAVEAESAMQIDSDADSQSEGPATLTESSEDASGKAEKKQKKVGFAASQSKPALASSNSSKALDINDKLKRAADNRQMLEQKKREEMEKKRAQAASKVEAMKKAREDSVKKPETASSNAAKKMEVEETKEDESKKTEAAQELLNKEEDAQSRRKRFLIQSLEEKKHNSASREAVEVTAPKPQGPAPAPQGPKLSLLAFLKKPALLTSESASTAQNASPTSDPEESESSGSEKDVTVTVDLKSAANVIPKPTGVPKPPSSFSDLRKFIRDGSDEHAAPAQKPAVVAPTPVIAAPTPAVESKPLPSASNFGFKPISRENSANNISAPSSIKSAASTTSSGPTSLAPPSLTSVQSQMRDAQMMPPPQSPSSIRATSVKSFIPIKLAQSPKASPHSPQQQVLSPKLSASMLYSPSPPRSPLRPRGFLDSPECQCPILDYCSDDDSDSEMDLPVPAWTQKENLYKALEMQTTIDPDEIFGKELGKNIDLNAIFGPNPRRPAYKK